MICCDIQGGQTSSGASSGGPPPFSKADGYFASSDNTRRLSWDLETNDGKNVKCRLNGTEYDLAKGTLFLVKTQGGKTDVEQLTHDLSAVQPNHESVKEFARKDPAVRQFLAVGD